MNWRGTDSSAMRCQIFKCDQRVQNTEHGCFTPLIFTFLGGVEKSTQVMTNNKLL